jgi:hypothetical protein
MARKKKKTVPISGAEAHAQGFTAADCPFDEEEQFVEFTQWNEEWDEAADKADQAENRRIGEIGVEPEEDVEEDEPEEKSVVKAEYRARYAENGTPNTCNDELAQLLNNLCLTKAGIDMPRFEAICFANGVDLSKYNRTTNGWQGRLRMTGRNILAGRVFAAGGLVLTPIEGAEPSYQMGSEWMASRRKVKVAA